MKKSKAHLLIPTDPRTGAVQSYPMSVWDSHSGRSIEPVYIPNFEITTTLLVKGYYKGRSSVTIRLEDQKDMKEYHMFLSDFMEIVPLLSSGQITGTFTYCKKGANYGIMFVQ